MKNKGEILVIDDTVASLRLISRMLEEAGYSVSLAESGEQALSMVAEKPPELILLDVRMPGLDGFEVFKRLKAKAGTVEIPVIFLTASTDPEDSLAGLKLGAVDFISKPYDREALLAKVGTHTELYRLRKKLEQQALELARERDRLSAVLTESRRVAAEHEKLLKAIEQAGDTIMITDSEGAIQYVNPAFERVTGYSRREALGSNPHILSSGRQNEAFYKDLWEKITSGKTWEGRMVNKRKDGALYTEDATISPVRDPQGRTINYVAVKRDITEQLKLETRLRQSQRMETVGLLAGGVAHDFNNILSAIMCNAGFLARDLAPDDPKQKDVKEILAASERAASLTRQLLAFSRRQIMATRVTDINGLMGGMVRMLGRVIGELVMLAVKLNPSPCTASVDPGQIEQVIMNLALNARDALSGGGVITLETELINPPAEFFDSHPDLPKGPLVCIKVGDTGCGMDAEVKSHLFEPFFTTKEQGKGTGLGLSTVFGIVKQSRGEITVESEPGKGAVFTVYLPFEETRSQDKDKDKEKDKEPSKEPLRKGHESVLLVEDEESLRRLGARILSSSGYEVLVAADAREALKLMEERGQPVDLLMTDVVMPGMSGRELGLELERRKLIGRALYMSGYTDDAIVKHGVLEPGIAFIYKPFTVDAVLLKLREVLDGPVGRAKA